ncbi:MAG: MarR family transcriptional regulator [Pseudomonadota bacterium]
MANFIDSETTRKAFLGKQAHDLLQLSSAQVAVIYEARGLAIPVKVSSTLQCLDRGGPMTLAELARQLDVTHQLAAQRVSKLISLRLLKRLEDPEDGRRSQLVLTRAGNHQAQLLAECISEIAEVYSDLYQEIECDLPAKLAAAINALKHNSIGQRLATLRAERGLGEPAAPTFDIDEEDEPDDE